MDDGLGARKPRGYRVEAAGRHPDRSRPAMLAFDDEAALREAYRSAVGAELINDEQATIAQARAYRIEVTVQT